MRPKNLELVAGLVGRRVAEQRRERGWTQEEFAERASLNYKYLQEIEQGHVNISLITLYKLANALQVRAALLLERPKQRTKRRPGRPKAAVVQMPVLYQESKYIGVYFRHGAWRARVKHKLVEYELGTFTSEREAARARDAKAVQLKGSKARLNFPNGKK